MYRLGRQADVAAYRDAAVGEEAHRLGHVLAALDLDHLGAGGHQLHGVAEGQFRGFLVGAEGHVGDDQGAVAAPGHHGGVVDHVGQGHRQGGIVALHHHAEGIAHQHGIDPGVVAEAGKAGVVAGQHGDFLAGGPELGHVGDGQAAGRGLAGHGFILPG